MPSSPFRVFTESSGIEGFVTDILEFNEIHDIAKETGDVGAFYIGRNWTCRGNIIRYNYFHHLFGPGLHGVRAVYLDDFSSNDVTRSCRIFVHLQLEN